MKHTDWCEEKGCRSVEEKICTVCKKAFYAGVKEGERKARTKHRHVKAVEDRGLTGALAIHYDMQRER